jgi:hypothetical protein
MNGTHYVVNKCRSLIGAKARTGDAMSESTDDPIATDTRVPPETDDEPIGTTTRVPPSATE